MRSGLKEFSCTLSNQSGPFITGCSASSKDERSLGEEIKVDEPLVQLCSTQDGAVQGCDVSKIWFS